MKVLILLTVLLPACLALPMEKADQRIVGGSTASPGQFKHQVSLQTNGQHFCGGSLISSTVVLTAAHCIYGSSNPITVVAGITNLGESGSRANVAQALYHGSYNPQVFENDVAVLHLASPINPGGNVQTISLASSNPSSGETLTLSGWGLTSYPGNIATALQWIRLRNIDLNTCAQQLQGANTPPVNTGNVCTSSPAGQGACQGDSGGPLINASGVQVGVVSWGVPCARGLPDVFTSVAFFRDWIVSN